MLYLAMIILIPVIGVLYMRLQKQDREIRELKQLAEDRKNRLHEAELQLEAERSRLPDLEKRLTDCGAREEQAGKEAQQWETACDAVHTLANTIHLYASLAEEESTSEPIREKQAEIIRMSEEILRVTPASRSTSGKERKEV